MCRDDVSDAAFPFLGFRALEVAMVPARVGRISFTGELGYEIWMPTDGQLRVYEALVEAGTDLGLVHFGARALQSLRLEKSFGTWAREFRPIYTPTEAGLDRFVDLGKPGLIGGGAARKAHTDGSPRRLVTFVVDAADADAIGDEPVWHDGKVVGWVTSGGYGHCVGKSIALGYVPAALADAHAPVRDRDPRRTARCVTRAPAPLRPARRKDAIVVTESRGGPRDTPPADSFARGLPRQCRWPSARAAKARSRNP